VSKYSGHNINLVEMDLERIRRLVKDQHDENLIHQTDDPCIKDTLRFLWEREVVHFQRFGEMLNTVQEHMGKSNLWCGCETKE